MKSYNEQYIKDRLYYTMNKLEVAKELQSRRDKIRMEYEELYEHITNYKDFINHMTAIYKNILYYKEMKQKNGLELIKTTFDKLSKIVQSDIIKNAKLHIENNKAYLTSSDYTLLEDTEGSAIRSIMSVYFSYIVLMTNNKYIPIMFLDETLNTSSIDTVEAIAPILEAMLKDVGLVCIEQRPTIFETLYPDVVYEVNKNKDTNITMVSVVD